MEDAHAGVEVTIAGGFACAAIGDAKDDPKATWHLNRFSDVFWLYFGMVTTQPASEEMSRWSIALRKPAQVPLSPGENLIRPSGLPSPVRGRLRYLDTHALRRSVFQRGRE